MALRQCLATSTKAAPRSTAQVASRFTGNRIQSLRVENCCSVGSSRDSSTLAPSRFEPRRTPATPFSFSISRHQLTLTPERLSWHRSFSSTSSSQHSDLTPPKPGEERRVTFVDKDLQRHHFEVADGDNLLDIAQANDLEMEGACGGSCACSTCHVIVTDENLYDKMEEPTDDENDMLDLAFGLTETSRLGCQVQMSKALDGLVVSAFSAAIIQRDALTIIR